MNSEIFKKYDTLLTESGFIPIPNCEQFSLAGSNYKAIIHKRISFILSESRCFLRIMRIT